MNKLLIEWKHFDKNGVTCKRCSQTGKNLNIVIKDLQNEFSSKGIKIQFQETKLPESRMTESNQILIDGILLENLIPDIKVGVNYCGSCSDLIEDPKGCQCRTVNQGGEIYEEVPIDLIKQAISNKLNNKGANYKLFKNNKRMKIQVLGSGCATCQKLHEITQKAVSEMGLKEKVEYLSGAEGMKGIIEMGVMQSPVLVVNGNPVMTGFTPDIEKIKKVITTGLKTEEKPSI